MSTAALPVSVAVSGGAAIAAASGGTAEATIAGLPFDFAALVQGLALPPADGETINAAAGEPPLAALGEPPLAEPGEAPADALAALLAGLAGMASLAAPVPPARPPAAGAGAAPAAANHGKPTLAGLAAAVATAPGATVAATAAGQVPGSASAVALTADTAGALRAETETLAPAKLADAEFATADSAQNPGQALLAPVGQARAATSAQVLAHVQAPVSSPGWAQELAQRVVWLTRNDAQSAMITLNPAHLGPVEVRLSLVADQATAVFVSAHGDVREALEAALPRLREMFAGAGIELGHAQVNSQSQRQAGGEGGAAAAREGSGAAPVDAAVDDNEAGRSLRPLSRGLVDTFA